jgi:DNA-directed RNA polymerase specialized sigma24 family protein
LSRPKAKADAFIELLQPLQKPLEVYCRRMLRNRSLVEDVVQSAVAAAFSEFDRGVARGSPFTSGTFLTMFPLKRLTVYQMKPWICCLNTLAR